jgi:ketosteroid isomerase-like protein
MDWKSQIEEMQRQGREASLARDVERLRGMWSDDLVVNSPINRIHSKAQVLDLLQKGIVAHLSFDEHIEATMRDGDVVVVMGRRLPV